MTDDTPRSHAPAGRSDQPDVANPAGNDADAVTAPQAIALRMGSVSPLWQRWMRAQVDGRELTAGIAAPGDDEAAGARLRLGVETVWEGWALHFATSRVAVDDTPAHTRMLVGDWSYAAGLCDVAASGDLDAVRTLADLIADVAELAGGSRRAGLVATGHAPARELLQRVRWAAALPLLARRTD
jgi:hypothetical protein